MATLSEIHTAICEGCGGHKETRILMGTLGQLIRVTRCHGTGCEHSKAWSELVEPLRMIAERHAICSVPITGKGVSAMGGDGF